MPRGASIFLRLLALAAALWLAAACDEGGHSPPGDTGTLDHQLPDAAAEAGPDDSAPADAPGGAQMAQLVAFAQQQMSKSGVPGAALAVVIDGKLAQVRGLGLRRQGGSEAVTPDSLFSLASVSKTFTAALAMALVDQGKVQTTDTAAAMIPKLSFSEPTLGSQITLHDLLSHTACTGYLDTATLASLSLDWQSPDSLVQLFELVTWPVWCPPGAVWSYSNMGFSMAGAALQKKLGQSFPALLEQQILTPAGMSRTTALGSVAAADADRTWGHGSGAPIPIGNASLLIDGPNNGVCSTAREMGRFAEVLLTGGNGVLSPSSLKAMSSAQADLSDQVTGQSYGFGLFRQERDGVVVISHSGTNRGWTADLTLVPGKKFAVAVLMNASTGWPAAVSNRALELFLGLPPYTPPPFSISDAELQQLAGTYHDPFTLGTIQISAAGSKLTADFAKWSHSAPLSQWGKRSFSVQVAGAMLQELGVSLLTLTIVPDASGQGKYLVTRLGVATATGP